MASARHKRSVLSGIRSRRVLIPLATVLVATSGIAVAASGDPAEQPAPAASLGSVIARTGSEVADRTAALEVSRSGERGKPEPQRPDPAERPAPAKPVKIELEPRWLTADLNVWSGPGEDNDLFTVLAAGKQVQVTGEVTGPWAQIMRGDRFAWVRAAYLVDEKPVVEEPADEEPADEEPADEETTSGGTDEETTSGGTDDAVSSASCPDGSDIESGLTTNAISVYRAVCAAYPAVTTWGGLRPGDDGDHGTGQALDIMVYSDSALGDAIATYAQEHAAELGVSEILWAQHIWSVARASEGWRPFEDRGSITANHYDHVHVSVY